MSATRSILLFTPLNLFNESIDSITKKLFGRKIQNIENSKVSIQKQNESDVNYQKIGIKIDNNTSTDPMFIAKRVINNNVNPEIKFVPGEKTSINELLRD